MTAPSLPDDMDMLAAEHALGLLESEELARARGLAAQNPVFRDRVAQWERQLAPLLDEVGGAQPSPELWGRIREQIESGADIPAANDNGAELRAQVRRWKWFAALSSAAAVVALTLLAVPQMRAVAPVDNAEPARVAAAPLVANIPIEGTPLNLDLTYLPDRESLLVSAVGLTADGVHDHELWLAGSDGALVSLGVVAPGEVRAHRVPADAARAMLAGSDLVLTREPLGGSSDGENAGPVVAQGTLGRV